jgi:hypothetical protein
MAVIREGFPLDQAPLLSLKIGAPDDQLTAANEVVNAWTVAACRKNTGLVPREGPAKNEAALAHMFKSAEVAIAPANSVGTAGTTVV